MEPCLTLRLLGFKSRAYINTVNNEIAIAFAGTHSPLDILIYDT